MRCVTTQGIDDEIKKASVFATLQISRKIRGQLIIVIWSNFGLFIRPSDKVFQIFHDGKFKNIISLRKYAMIECLKHVD